MNQINRPEMKAEARRAMLGKSPSVFLVAIAFLLLLLVLEGLSGRMNPMPDLEAMAAAETVEEVQKIMENWYAARPGLTARLLTTAIEIMSLMLSVGFTSYCLNISRNIQGGFGDLFDAFGNFFRILWLNIMIGVLVFLWSLLLVIPGIIAAYRYSLAIYILLDDPDKPAIVCLRESCRLTRGRKWELFLLDLSLIGWRLLGVFLPAQIYIAPYIQITKANFYRAISGRWEAPAHFDFEV